MEVQISHQDSDFIYFTSEMVGSHGSFAFYFLRTLYTVSHSGSTILHSYQQSTGVPHIFSTSAPTLDFSCVFGNRHSKSCEIISHCGFDSLLLDNESCQQLFLCLFGHLYIFYIYSHPLPIFEQIFLFSFSCVSSAYIFKCSVQFSSVQFSRSVVSDSLQPHESQPLSNRWFAKIFSNFIDCLFILYSEYSKSNYILTFTIVPIFSGFHVTTQSSHLSLKFFQTFFYLLKIFNYI